MITPDEGQNKRRSILFVAPTTGKTGNKTTADRIKYHLDHPPYSCILRDVDDFVSKQHLQSFIVQHNVRLVIGLHALKSGWILEHCNQPTVVIFGGTDVNEFSDSKEKLEKMAKVVLKAKKLITFSSSMKKKAKNLWPLLFDEIFVTIPQGVSVNPSDLKLQQFLLQHDYCLKDVPPYLFTLVCGVRPVKDPMYLLRHFSEWFKSKRLGLLVIIGPRCDFDYCQIFENEVNANPGIVYIDGLSLEDTHAAIQSSFALVNSSTSEGMSGAILEAMALGVPVIARNIPGNSAVISHDKNGLLYDTPEEFITQAERLIANSQLKQRIIESAGQEINNRYNIELEKISYYNVLESIFRD